MSKVNRHIVPVHVEEVWPYMRDHAIPTTPYAREQLEKCRTYEAPSKAHIKRLKRDRPLVLRPRLRAPLDPAPRLYGSTLMSYASASKSIVRKDAVRTLYPKTFKPEPPAGLRAAWLTPPSPQKQDDDWDLDVINARLDRLSAEFEQAKREARHG